MRRTIFIVITMLFILLFADSIDELLHTGDYFFKRGEYSDALSRYTRAESLSPNDANILWRIGAAYNRISMNLVSKARTDTFKVANEYLTNALHINQKIARIHSELAWNLTYMGLLTGNLTNFAMARRVKEEIDYALSLDSTIADAHYIFGLWHRTVGAVSILKRKPNGLGDASLKSARAEFERAVELKPDCALFKLELAKQFLFDGDTASAYSELTKIAETSDLPVNRPYKKDADDMLKELSSK